MSNEEFEKATTAARRLGETITEVARRRGAIVDAFVDGLTTTPAPLDPAAVKAGDTVTLTRGKAVVTDEVRQVRPHVPKDVAFGIVLDQDPGTVYRWVGGSPEHWTLTAHQPAPEPEVEWEVEQVAEVSLRGCHAAPLTTLRAIRTDAGWRTVNGDWADVNVESARPLVVIDPAAVDVDALFFVYSRHQGDARSSLRAVLAELGIEATR